jgi:SPP1 family predicted phage head-tail adaptor
MARTANIGEMLEQVVIQTRTATPNAYGEDVETWATYTTVWANIESNRRATDLEAYIAGAGKERQRTQYVARIYYDPAITVDVHRLSWGGKFYDILQAFDPTGRRQWTELRIQEIN